MIKKLGVALVKMHEYDKACQHYENSIRLLGDDEVQFEYYELLIRVSTFFKADLKIIFSYGVLYIIVF